MRDILRRVRLTPYRKGYGPTFTLIMWVTNRTDWRGQTYIGYELRQHEHSVPFGERWNLQARAKLPHTRTTVLFTGEDFAGSPMHADDSDQCVASLLGFLTLRPGDTDREYFDNYTPAQLAYCDAHAETLGAEIYARFGEV